MNRFEAAEDFVPRNQGDGKPPMLLQIGLCSLCDDEILSLADFSQDVRVDQTGH
jgi:hypothetical protein